MRRATRGFTLVELLTVIAIVSVLAALLLPAIQSSREAARRIQCQNSVRQLSVAALHHHDAHEIFPTGGWGWYWMGDPDRGVGRDQPGGWIYNILPFMELPALHALPADGDRDAITPKQREGALRMSVTQMPLLMCPSRRDLPLQVKPSTYFGNNVAQGPAGALVSRSDYAINSGDRNWNETSNFPGDTPGSTAADYAMGETFAWTWTPHGDVQTASGIAAHDRLLTGVSFQRSEIGLRELSDGASQTYLIGEKYLDPADYETGVDRSDNETWATGWNNDNFRCAFDPPALNREALPSRSCQTMIYGSSHPAGWIMAWCDGHVELLSFELDVQTHRASAHRSDDGRPIGLPPTCPSGGI
jgi:prepilin-type N-terminal cleavage/methylation domain-containing protein